MKIVPASPDNLAKLGIRIIASFDRDHLVKFCEKMSPSSTIFVEFADNLPELAKVFLFEICSPTWQQKQFCETLNRVLDEIFNGDGIIMDPRDVTWE